MITADSVVCHLPATHVVVIFFHHRTLWQIILPHSQQKTGCGERLCSAPSIIHVIRVGLPSPDFAEGSMVGAIGAPVPIAKFGCCQGQCIWHRSTQAALQPCALPWRPVQWSISCAATAWQRQQMQQPKETMGRPTTQLP